MILVHKMETTMHHIFIKSIHFLFFIFFKHDKVIISFPNKKAFSKINYIKSIDLIEL